MSDEVFASFLATASYTAGPLHATVDGRDESPEHWIVETVSFDAAYGGERVPAYLLLPKNVSPPYQTVVYWPAAAALRAAVPRRPETVGQSDPAPPAAQRPRRPLSRLHGHL